MSTRSLALVLPPPLKPFQAKGDWELAEETCGTRLPDDYKDFIRSYGRGTICEFMRVLNPFSDNPYANLIEQAKLQLGGLREIRDEWPGEVPYALFPEQDGLLPVAISDNGDVVYWLTKGDAGQWTIVVNEGRGPDFEEFACDLTTFIEGIVTRSIRCRIFPDDAFVGNPEFRGFMPNDGESEVAYPRLQPGDRGGKA